MVFAPNVERRMHGLWLLALSKHGFVGAGPDPRGAAAYHVDRYGSTSSHTSDAIGLDPRPLWVLASLGDAGLRLSLLNRKYHRRRWDHDSQHHRFGTFEESGSPRIGQLVKLGSSLGKDEYR